MYGIPDRLKALSAAEEQVLLALWDCKPPVTILFRPNKPCIQLP